jgi:hypothetical protein
MSRRLDAVRERNAENAKKWEERKERARNFRDSGYNLQSPEQKSDYVPTSPPTEFVMIIIREVNEALRLLAPFLEKDTFSEDGKTIFTNYLNSVRQHISTRARLDRIWRENVAYMMGGTDLETPLNYFFPPEMNFKPMEMQKRLHALMRNLERTKQAYVKRDRETAAKRA